MCSGNLTNYGKTNTKTRGNMEKLVFCIDPDRIENVRDGVNL